MKLIDELSTRFSRRIGTPRRRLDYSPRDRGASRRRIVTPWSVRNASGLVTSHTGIVTSHTGAYTNPSTANDCGCGECVCGCRGVPTWSGGSGAFDNTSTLQLTIAGVTICGCITATPPLFGSVVVTGVTPNGTYCANGFEGFPCQMFAFGGTGHLTQYSFNNCTSTVLLDISYPWGITITFSSGIVTVSIRGPGDLSGKAGFIFRGSAPFDCNDGATISNIYTGCPSYYSADNNCGYGGSVVIVTTGC